MPEEQVMDSKQFEIQLAVAAAFTVKVTYAGKPAKGVTVHALPKDLTIPGGFFEAKTDDDGVARDFTRSFFPGKIPILTDLMRAFMELIGQVNPLEPANYLFIAGAETAEGEYFYAWKDNVKVALGGSLELKLKFSENVDQLPTFKITIETDAEWTADLLQAFADALNTILDGLSAIGLDTIDIVKTTTAGNVLTVEFRYMPKSPLAWFIPIIIILALIIAGVVVVRWAFGEAAGPIVKLALIAVIAAAVVGGGAYAVHKLKPSKG